MQIRTQLAAADAPSTAGPIRVVTKGTGELIRSLEEELDRVTDLMTKLKG